MARSGREDRPGLLDEPPDEVWVSFIDGPRGLSIRERLAGTLIALNLGALIALGIVAMTLVALVLTLSLGGRGATTRVERVHAGAAAPVSAASGAPPHCSSLLRGLHHRRISRAQFVRMVWCERSGGHPNSSIDQFVSAP